MEFFLGFFVGTFQHDSGGRMKTFLEANLVFLVCQSCGLFSFLWKVFLCHLLSYKMHFENDVRTRVGCILRSPVATYVAMLLAYVHKLCRRGVVSVCLSQLTQECSMRCCIIVSQHSPVFACSLLDHLSINSMTRGAVLLLSLKSWKARD